MNPCLGISGTSPTLLVESGPKAMSMKTDEWAGGRMRGLLPMPESEEADLGKRFGWNLNRGR